MSKPEYPPIDFVDENDQVIGSGEIEEAWLSGAIHRIVAIFVRRPSDNALLLQKRSVKMETAPGLWDFSAAGHVDTGETYEQAAARELYEELGIRAEPLMIGKYFEKYTNEEGIKLNRFYAVFTADFEEFPPKLQASELDGAAWFSRQEIELMQAATPEVFTKSLFTAQKEVPGI